MDTTNPTIEPDFIFGTLATDDLRLASIKKEHSGLWHGQRLSPQDPRPDEPITVTIGVGPDISADRVTLYVTTDGSEPRGQHGVAENGIAIPLEKIHVDWDTLLWGYRDTWQASIPPQPAGTHVQYIIEAWQTVSGASVYAGRRIPRQVFGFFVDEQTVPQWLREAVIYQIFVDRFAPDPDADFIQTDNLNAHYGGTLKGITGKLDYLAELGITCVWLTPIFTSPTYHRYDTTDFFSIDAMLGTEDDLRTLIAEAHRRDIRVVLDFVANHISHRHPIFLQAQQNGGTPYADWFTFNNHPYEYDTFFGVKSMPKVNTDHPSARQYLIEAAQYWLRAGCDGYRLDHAQGPTHAFWSIFRRATRAVKSDSVTFGEVVEPPSLQRSFAGRMDGTLDFLLHQALRNFFAYNQLTASQFNAFLQRHMSYFPENFILPSFLDNHDMNRFLWVVHGDVRRLKLAALCQFTLPGPPIIYYGTEVGLSQKAHVGPMEECRLPMIWDEAAQDRHLLGFYEDVIALRHEGKTEWAQPRTVLALDDARGIYVYRVGRFTIALNNCDCPAEIALPPHETTRLELATVPHVSWARTTGILQIPAYGGVCLRDMG